MQIRDIENREDLSELLESFYDSAFKDELIGPYFTEVAKLDLDSHLPVITDFWDSILFGTANYKGNVMKVHMSLDDKRQLGKVHFDRWIELFHSTINDRFMGKNATMMIERSKVIAATMGYKLDATRGKR